MIASHFRRPTQDDKALIGLALLNVGIKARVRSFPTQLRVCFTGGDRETVASVLNENGFRHASGRPFDVHSFNQPHEVFVSGVSL